MEITDPSTVAALISIAEGMTRRAAVQQNYAPARTQRARCRCGKCARCLDNARWERIFREKFEDPEYYRQTRLHSSSSLGWLRGMG